MASLGKFFNRQRAEPLGNKAEAEEKEKRIREGAAHQAYLEMGMRLITGYAMEARRLIKERSLNPRANTLVMISADEIVAIDELMKALLARASELEKTDAVQG